MKKICFGFRRVVYLLVGIVLAVSVGATPIQANAMAAERDDGTWLWPLPSDTLNSVVDWAGCIGSGYVCQFGCGVVHPCSASSHSRELGHAGLDLGVVVGTSVYASAAGKVVAYGYSDARGNTMVVEHEYQSGYSYYSYYEHLNANAVSVGAVVQAGQTIAYSGKSGVGYEPHLHFSIVFGPSNSIYSLGDITTFEGGGWLLNNTYAIGRILVNPAATNEVSIGDLPSGNLSRHQGSIHYTCDPIHVNIGMRGIVVSSDSPWYYSGTPTRALTYGMVNNEVKWLQQALNIVIGAGLGLDGSFGPATQNAVIAYQNHFGLAADGSFGPASLACMLEQLYARGYMSDGSVPLPSDPVTDFVSRFYSVSLQREPDEEGVGWWTEELLSGTSDGAGLAQGFLCGGEFVNKGYSNTEYVKVLYKTFFDREADESEMAFWVNGLNSGTTRESVLAGFVNSEEFFALCDSFGIARGTMLETGTAVNAGIGQFTERLYTEVFKRDGEEGGMEYWALAIAKGECTPEEAAKNFFTSTEYLNKNSSNEEYVKALYRTFMGREWDEAGLKYWVNALAIDASRASVLSEFAASKEFKSIMAGYGL